MDISKVFKFIFLSLAFVVAVVIIFWGVSWFSLSVLGIFINKPGNHVTVSSADLENSIDSAQAQTNPSQQILPQQSAQPSSLVIDAPSAISVSFGNGANNVLFAKNSSEELPVASLTKLMTALVVLKNYDLTKEVTIDQAAMSVEGEQGDLQLGQVLSVKDLLYIMLIESSNRAAYALSEVMGADAFIVAMNTEAQTMGLTHTHFADSSGLNADSYSSAQNLATLTEYLFENYPLFLQIVSLKTYNLYLDNGVFHHTLTNTNELLGTDNVIGGKTGFTDDANGCLMVIQQNPNSGNDVVSVLLGSNDRFGEMQKLIEWVSR